MGEEGSWQQEVRRKAKTVREGVKEKKKKNRKKKNNHWGLGFPPQYLGQPSQELVVRKWWWREEGVVREETGEGPSRITGSFFPLSLQARPQTLMSKAPVYCNLVDLRRCPRSPPSNPVCPPLQRLDAWEQHLDPNSGRCFYINSLTGCKSWKPPRHTRTRETVRPSLLLVPCPLSLLLSPLDPQSSMFSHWDSRKITRIKKL